MKKAFKFIIFLLFLIAGFLILSICFLPQVSNFLIKPIIIRKLSTYLKAEKISIERLSLTYDGEVKIKGTEIKNAMISNVTVVKAELPDISFKTNLYSLIKGKFIFNNVIFNQPDVSLKLQSKSQTDIMKNDKPPRLQGRLPSIISNISIINGNLAISLKNFNANLSSVSGDIKINQLTSPIDFYFSFKHLDSSGDVKGKVGFKYSLSQLHLSLVEVSYHLKNLLVKDISEELPYLQDFSFMIDAEGNLSYDNEGLTNEGSLRIRELKYNLPQKGQVKLTAINLYNKLNLTHNEFNGLLTLDSDFSKIQANLKTILSEGKKTIINLNASINLNDASDIFHLFLPRLRINKTEGILNANGKIYLVNEHNSLLDWALQEGSFEVKLDNFEYWAEVENSTWDGKIPKHVRLDKFYIEDLSFNKDGNIKLKNISIRNVETEDITAANINLPRVTLKIDWNLLLGKGCIDFKQNLSTFDISYQLDKISFKNVPINLLQSPQPLNVSFSVNAKGKFSYNGEINGFFNLDSTFAQVNANFGTKNKGIVINFESIINLTNSLKLFQGFIPWLKDSKIKGVLGINGKFHLINNNNLSPQVMQQGIFNIKLNKFSYLEENQLHISNDEAYGYIKFDKRAGTIIITAELKSSPVFVSNTKDVNIELVPKSLTLNFSFHPQDKKIDIEDFSLKLEQDTTITGKGFLEYDNVSIKNHYFQGNFKIYYPFISNLVNFIPDFQLNQWFRAEWIEGNFNFKGKVISTKLTISDVNIKNAISSKEIVLPIKTFNTNFSFDFAKNAFFIKELNLSSELGDVELQKEVQLNTPREFALAIEYRTDLAILKNIITHWKLIPFSQVDLSGKLDSNFIIKRKDNKFFIEWKIIIEDFKLGTTSLKGIIIDEKQISISGDIETSTEFSYIKGVNLKVDSNILSGAINFFIGRDTNYFLKELSLTLNYIPDKINKIWEIFLPGKIEGTKQAKFSVNLKRQSSAIDISGVLLTLHSDFSGSIKLPGLEIKFIEPLQTQVEGEKIHINCKLEVNKGTVEVINIDDKISNTSRDREQFSIKLKNVEISEKMVGILGRVNPIFFTKEGTLSGQLNAAIILTTPNLIKNYSKMKQGINALLEQLQGEGYIETINLKITGSPLLDEILIHIGAEEQNLPELKPQKTEIKILDGIVHYNDFYFTMNDIPIRLSGKIYLRDGQLNMRMRLPIVNTMLAKFPKLERALGKELKLTVRGSIIKPEINWDEVIVEITKDLILNKIFERILEKH